MPTLDFTEIPSAKADKSKPGQQDTFEFFARDVLEYIGFTIISAPNRGPDQGKDIVVEETRRGIGGESKIRWLVSCKHYAHMGRSVNPEDEINILERVQIHKCQGFLGFYSTIQSTGLATILERLCNIESQVYDKERIERTLLDSSIGRTIAKRYLPESIKKWVSDTGAPADLMMEPEELLCDYTNENLISPKPRGIIVMASKYPRQEKTIHYEEIYWCLKGEPDRILEQRCWNKGLITAWEDIPDVIIPTVYLKWCMSIMNELRDGNTYSDSAFSKLKQFLICLYPYVARELRAEEKERIKVLKTIPYNI